jgi:cytochrome c556
MTRLRLLMLVLIGAAAAVTMAADPAKDNEEQKARDTLMEKKLEYAQQVLAGLTREDYDLVVKNAKAMNLMTDLQKFFRADSPEYYAQLKIFEFANNELVRLAEERNLDGISTAYVQLTLSCVNCHKYVRAHQQ